MAHGHEKHFPATRCFHLRPTYHIVSGISLLWLFWYSTHTWMDITQHPIPDPPENTTYSRTRTTGGVIDPPNELGI